jgi:hypothetical protein
MDHTCLHSGVGSWFSETRWGCAGYICAKYQFDLTYMAKHSINTVEAGYTAGIWGHHEHPRYKLTSL